MTKIVPDIVKILCRADAALNKLLAKYGLDHRIVQVPGCLFPVNLGIPDARLFSIRPLFTLDFYAGVPGRIAKEIKELPADEQDEFIPETFLDELVKEVSQIPGLPWVSICRTHKPPTTTEAG